MAVVDLAAQRKVWETLFTRLPDQAPLADQIIKREMQLLKSQPKCSLGPFFLDQVDPTKVTELVKSRFYDSQLIEAVACVAQVISLAPNNQEMVALNRIHRWFRNLRLIGNGTNISGFAMFATLENSKSSPFVIKAPQDPNDVTTINELVIGLWGTNQMRRLGVPNFAQVYTGFQCSIPVFNPIDRTVSSWCERGQKSYYIVYENIDPSTGVDQQCRIMTPGQFLPIFIQIPLALRAAAQTCGFTHWDLHPANVVLRVLSEVVSIPYESKYGKVYLNANMVATIIDYGRSFINIKLPGSNTYEGFADLTKAGPFAETFVLGDVHRFLCACMVLSKQNPALNAVLGKILAFFSGTMAPKSYLYITGQWNYQLWPTADTKKLTIDGFIDHVLLVAQSMNPPIYLIGSGPALQKIYSCRDGAVCARSENEALEEITTPHPPRDLFDYLDRVDLFTAKGVTPILTGGADPLELYKRSLEDYIRLAEITEKDLSGTVLLNLQGKRPIEIVRWPNMEQYIAYVSRLLGVEDNLEQLAFEFTVLRQFAARSNIAAPPDLVSPIRARFTPYIENLKHDALVVKTVVENPEFVEWIKREKRLAWLQNTFPQIMAIISVP